MENIQAKTRTDLAIELLKIKTKTRLNQGYDTLLLSDINEVLYIADGAIIEPLSKKELEVIR